MAISIPLEVAVSFLHIFAFVLAIGAEKRRSTGKVVPDEYDERTYALYDSDASTAYGMAAFAVVLVSHQMPLLRQRTHGRRPWDPLAAVPFPL